MRGRVERSAFAKTGGAEQAVLDERANGDRLRGKAALVELPEDVFGTSLELLRPDDAFSSCQPLFVFVSKSRQSTSDQLPLRIAFWGPNRQ